MSSPEGEACCAQESLSRVDGSGLHPTLLRHQRDSDGKWQIENEVQGSTFPKRVVTLLRLATVTM